MEEILKNNFETIYKDFKDYESHYNSAKEGINKQREDFKAKAVTIEDDEVLINELFNLSVKPIQSEADLGILRNKLISTYDAYKIVLDFPESIKEEIRNLKRPLQIYTIINGEQVDIDKEKSALFKEEARKAHSELVKGLREK